MSIPVPAGQAKLVISLFMKDRDMLKTASASLVAAFGPLDLMSAWLPFDFTVYYTKEMGAPLFRRVLAFKQLIHQAALPDIKLQTNEIERLLSGPQSNRRINIDPGYLLRERFVLATGKNFAHRIYLRDGIYADLTLLYQKKAFRTLPWTYPDYAEKRMHHFLTSIRKKYCRDLKGSIDSPQGFSRYT